MKRFMKPTVCSLCCICCFALIITTGCRSSFSTSVNDTTAVSVLRESETLSESTSTNIPENLTVKNNSIVKREDWGAYYVCDYNKDNYFTVYMQISNITTSSENIAYIEEAIKEYNSEVSSGRKISLSNEDKNLEYAVADVNLYIPKGQNINDYIGVPLSQSVSIKGEGDWKDKNGNIYQFKGIKGYGLPESSNEHNFYSFICEIMKCNQKFSEGDYCQTKIIYSIIKDVVTPYSFQFQYPIPSEKNNKDDYNRITFEISKVI